MTTTKQTTVQTLSVTFAGMRPFRVRIEEVGRTDRGYGSVTYKATAVKTGNVEGFIARRQSYNNHSDWGMRTLDAKHVFLGDNLTIDQAVEKLIRI